MTLATTLALKLTARQSKTFDLMTPAGYLEKIIEKTIADGTGAAQADLFFSDVRTIGATSNDDLDLAGSLTDIFGATITFAKVKAIYIENPSTNNGDVVVGNEGTNPLVGWFGAGTHTIAIKPGGFLLIASPTVAGYTVTAGTGDKLRVRNAGSASADIPVIIIGTSA